MELVKIVCRCKDCEYSAIRNSRTDFYCYYWDYEAGMSPNVVDKDDFCSNAVLIQK
jgi:hypothetical protein